MTLNPSPQLDHILGRYGTFIVERAGSDVDAALDSLRQWRDNIRVIRQTIQNDVSSTKVRLFVSHSPLRAPAASLTRCP